MNASRQMCGDVFFKREKRNAKTEVQEAKAGKQDLEPGGSLRTQCPCCWNLVELDRSSDVPKNIWEQQCGHFSVFRNHLIGHCLCPGSGKHPNLPPR